MSENNNQQQQPKRSGFNWANIGILIIAALFIVAMVYSLRGCNNNKNEISYSKAVAEYVGRKDAYQDGGVSIIVTPAKDSAVQGSYVVYVTG